MVKKKSFIVDKKNRLHKKLDAQKKGHKGLDEFYSGEQKEKEKRETIEDQIFEHLKKETRKAIDKNAKT